MRHRFLQLLEGGVTTLPYVVLELGTPDPPGLYYNVFRTLEGVPTRLTEFTFNTGRAPVLDNPRLSPDGNWIVIGVNFFDESPFGSGIIVVPANAVTADGDEIVVFEDGGVADWALHPSWHPDSDQFVFQWGPAAVADGAFAGAIQRAERTNPGATPTELWTPDTFSPDAQQMGAYRPTYSPDGSKIAFIVNVDAGGFPSWDPVRSKQGLWVMNADGSGDVQIRPWSDPAENDVYLFRGAQIAWSQDSEWIAFRPAGFGASEDFGLYKIRPDGTDETLLAAGHPDENLVAWQIDISAWQADPDYLLATVNGGIYGTGWGIYRVAADGSGVTELLPGTDPFSPFGGNYFRQVYRNHLTGRIEWIRLKNPGILRTSEVDLSAAEDAHDLSSDVGDQFYDGTGFDWL